MYLISVEDLNKFEPDWVCPPGDLILEAMEFYSISPEDLQKKSEHSAEYIKAVLVGDESVTEDFAKKLSEIFNRPVRYWIAIEKRYQEDCKRLGLNE